MAPLIISKIGGLNTQPNELEVQPGSLAVAENVEINRDGVVEVARGFEDFSSNLPDFTPAQLIVSGGVAYLHLDNGIWYYNGTNWLRKRGAFGTSLSDPVALAHSNGHLYVSTVDNIILDINLSTGTRSILAGRFGAVGAHVDGTGDAARFNSLRGIAIDGDNLYVSDGANHCIRKVVISTGVVTTPYGTTGTTNAHTDGTGNAARFDAPNGLAITGGDLYVADAGNNCIRKIVISTGVVTTPVGVADPAITSGHTDGTGNAARFNAPKGLAISGGDLHVADANNHCVRKVVISTGVVTTPVGTTGTTSGHTDGTGNAARFNAPDKLAITGDDLYVSDTNNNCIRKVVISTGVVTTPYGVAAPGTTAGSSDGIGNASGFSSPFSLAVVDTYQLYVADNGNDIVRKVYLSTGYVSTIDGASGVNASSTGPPLANGLIVGPS